MKNNKLMELPLLAVEALQESDMMLVAGGTTSGDEGSTNNSSGMCTGTNNGSGTCSGTNNSSGKCGFIKPPTEPEPIH